MFPNKRNFLFSFHINLLLTIWLALLSLSGCAASRLTKPQEPVALTENQEINLGKLLKAGVVQEYDGEFIDRDLNQYLNDVGLKLVKISQRPLLPYTFVILNSSEINAFSLPGGIIFITRGFLVKLENEAQLAAVFAHEIGHLEARHALGQLQRQIPLIHQLQTTGKVSYEENHEALLALARLTDEFFKLRFSPAEESQANLLAMDYSFKAGYNPRSLHEMMQLLVKGDKDKAESTRSYGKNHDITKDSPSLVLQELSKKHPESLKSQILILNKEIFQRKIDPVKKVHIAYEYWDEAEALMKKGEYHVAIQNYRKALLMDKNQALFYTGLGMAFLRLNQYRSAINNLEEGVKRDPQLFKAKAFLGLGLIETHDWIPAVNILSQAVDLIPTRPLPYYYRGLAFEGLNSSARAIQDYRTVIFLDAKGELAEKAKTRLIRLGRFS